MKKAISCAAACALVVFALALAGCSIVRPTVSNSHSEKSGMQEATDIMSSESASATASSPKATTNNSLSSASSISNAPALEKVGADIEAIAAASGMDMGVSVVDLTTGGYAEYHGANQMIAASMVKLVIAYAFLEQVKAGAHSLDEPYTLKESDIVGGTGTIGGLGPGAQVSYRDLVSKMISASDNTATNILIDTVGGMGEVNATAREQGLSATQLNRYMMDTAASGMDIENYTSADDVAMLLHKAYSGEFVDVPSSALVMQALRDQEDRAGILSGLPEGTLFAHKTGTLSMVRHDGGIVESNHPYIVVVLCSAPGFSEQKAIDTQAQIGAATYADIVG